LALSLRPQRTVHTGATRTLHIAVVSHLYRGNAFIQEYHYVELDPYRNMTWGERYISMDRYIDSLIYEMGIHTYQTI